MRKFAVILFIVICSNCSSQNLKNYQWKNRLVILVGDKNDSVIKEQLKLLTSLQNELDERQIKVLHSNNGIREELNLNPKFVGLILIGKDGGIKLKKPYVVQPGSLFSLIDGMPMRRAELKNK